MKAVQVVARSQPEFVDMPKPELQEGYALIKTLRLALCGSDIRYIHNLDDDAYPSPPGATGHEMVGVIEDIQPNDAGLKVGDKVLALAPDHLAMTEYYLTPIPDLFKLDESVPLEHQVQAQQFGTVIYASKRLPDVKGKTVAVIGQGSAGLWFNTVLEDLGAKTIIALDLKAYRLQISSHYGATHTIHNVDIDPIEALKAINNGELADVVVEVAGEKPAVSLAIDLVKDAGFILYFGVPRYEHVEFPMLKFFFKCITARAIVGASHEVGHTSTRKALDWITSGKIDVAPMITHTMPFKDVLEAYELHRLQDEGAVKIVIDMEAT
jgi:threonine dehydrogenase-like Zn-dependent dehydrogenase